MCLNIKQAVTACDICEKHKRKVDIEISIVSMLEMV